MSRFRIGCAAAVLAWAGLMLVGAVPGRASAEVRVLGSSQMYHAFIEASLAPFTRATGVAATAEDRCTRDAVPALLAGSCDVGAMAAGLSDEERARDPRLTATLVARDDIAVLAPRGCPVKGVSLEQLRRLMTGEIRTWRELGGPDDAVTVVLPPADTACRRNFAAAVMGDAPFRADAVESPSTWDVLGYAKGLPAVTFISFGAVSGNRDFRLLEVDGRAPGAPRYGIAQNLYFVTLGPPTGEAKRFVDFFRTGPGRALIRRAGLVPAP